LKSHSTW